MTEKSFDSGARLLGRESLEDGSTLSCEDIERDWSVRLGELNFGVPLI